MTDGCPDSVELTTDSTYQFPDTDGDGIDDRWDQCLNEPENYNGYLDWDGCIDDSWSRFSKDLIDSDYDSILMMLMHVQQNVKILTNSKMKTVVLMF